MTKGLILAVPILFFTLEANAAWPVFPLFRQTCQRMNDQAQLIEARVLDGDFDTTRALFTKDGEFNFDPYANDYRNALQSKFWTTLGKHRHKGRWLDIGVSHVAARQFFQETSGDTSQVVGITRTTGTDVKELKQLAKDYPDRFSFHIEPAQQLNQRRHGIFDVVTDVIAATTYDHPGDVLKGIHKVTKPGSDVFISMVFERYSVNPAVNKYFRLKQGWWNVPTIRFYESLGGFSHRSHDWAYLGEYPSGYYVMRIHLTRTDQHFRAPELLPVYLEANSGGPPTRTWELLD